MYRYKYRLIIRRFVEILLSNSKRGKVLYLHQNMSELCTIRPGSLTCLRPE
jgi:hypothetical protein